jgi:cbb3-type cytochrome oxidase maturation protein
MGVAGAIAGNVMLLSFALYSGTFADMSPEFFRLFEVLSLWVSLPSLTYCAREFYRGALSSLLTRTPHMDLPVSLGILAGAGWGTYKVLLGDATQLTVSRDERLPIEKLRSCEMSVLLVVLPLSLMVSTLAVLAFIGAVRRGEFDDLETPARRMLLDDRTQSQGVAKGNQASGRDSEVSS